MMSMLRDIQGLPLFKEIGLTVELLRLEYRGNIAKAYLPHIVKEALKLDPQKDNALIMIHDEETGVYVLIKDNDLAAKMKPLILQARQANEKLRQKSNSLPKEQKQE